MLGMNDDKKAQAQIEGLATLLVLDDEIKKLSNLREFGFFTTNETHRLIPYHTACLWQRRGYVGQMILAQSGVAEIDAHAPSNQWLVEFIGKIQQTDNAKIIHKVNLAELEGDDNENFFPKAVLWCPFLNKSNELSGGLLFFRETDFTQSEIKMITWLIASYQYTWQILNKHKLKPSWKKVKEHHLRIGVTFFIIAILLFPIRLSVLGTATVVPKDPVLINAPLHGVIKTFAVKPGQYVHANQLLLSFDKTDLIADKEVNQKNFQLTEAKLRTAVNGSFDNKEARFEIPILQAQLNIDKAHVDYTNALLAKADVFSPSAGVVVFDSKEDWIGQPVETGTRILVIADPKNVQLRVMLPIANMIQLEVGAKGDFF
ncbi:MAG: HlyD family secretion protein, partial [Gammaproteobacteria bacterium]